MYDLPDNLDLNVFIGSYLTSISFGVGSVHLNFNTLTDQSGAASRLGLDIYIQVSLLSLEQEKLIKVGDYQQIAALGVLLNQDVVDAHIPEKQTLVVEFLGGYKIMLEGDTYYESYNIHLPGWEDNIFV